MAETPKKPVILDSFDKKHLQQIAALENKVAAIYAELCKEVGIVGTLFGGKVDLEKVFKLGDYPEINKKIDQIIESLHDRLGSAIVDGVTAQWQLANEKNDDLVRKVFGKDLDNLTEDQITRYFTSNQSALEAFLKRKDKGLGLSQKVWKYAKEAKVDIESALELGIKTGQSAASIARDLKQYLKEPDKLFRRVRDKDGKLHLSKAAQAYHPGQGVYRSSYKNALRLAVTEANMAYRASDYERVQNFDFVVGIEVRLSNNHTLNGKPFYDICDELKGKYPKDFKFRGWHPFCRCHAITILKTREELMADNQRILDGQEPTEDSVNSVNDLPDNFKSWAVKNKSRILAADEKGTLPYFITDNAHYIEYSPRYGVALGVKHGRSAKKEAIKIYQDLPAPALTKEVLVNTQEVAHAMGITETVRPMTFLQADKGRGNISWGKAREYSENCQSVVVVHEARLRGINVTALGYNFDKESVQFELGEHFEYAWEHPKTHKIPTPSVIKGDTFAEIKNKLEIATKATGRYHIGVNMENNVGHVLTCERLTDGNLLFYDPQCDEFINISEYEDYGVISFELLKVDKLLLRKEILTAIARRL